MRFEWKLGGDEQATTGRAERDREDLGAGGTFQMRETEFQESRGFQTVSISHMGGI